MMHELRNEHGRIDGAKLPPIGEIVECHMFDGQTFPAHRRVSFEPGCGWCWEHASGWMIAGHPLMMSWSEIDKRGE